MSAELGGTHPGVFDVAVGAFEVAVFSDEFGKGPKRSLVGHGISTVVNGRHGKPVAPPCLVVAQAAALRTEISHDGMFVAAGLHRRRPLLASCFGLIGLLRTQ